MTDEHLAQDDELSDEELDDQEAAALPDREVMSILQPPLIYQPIDPLDPLPPAAE
jgi:hypothetical protein